MCGLFGLLRAPEGEHREWASDAFVIFGALAEERGRDSAGVAFVGDNDVRVVKGLGSFSSVWRPDLLPALDAAPLALGHTRWATQGSAQELVNASPQVVEGVVSGGPSAGSRNVIVATHNGDVDALALRAGFALPQPAGGTDSEPIFQALATAGHDTGRIADVLSAILGRAALAWADRGRLHLARAALSPLTVAVDADRNLYWVSNPRWLVEVERHTPVRFVTRWMLREGTYLAVDREQRIVARSGFRPTARPADMDVRVWTGFTEADMMRDRAELRHLVAAECVPAA
ncbi:MAG TPA: hypothetical protein VH912_06120 [Streptosporangiaceae bacterium]|jgi:glutamine phosphoribosylpyrophosphate amidotransferase